MSRTPPKVLPNGMVAIQRHAPPRTRRTTTGTLGPNHPRSYFGQSPQRNWPKLTITSRLIAVEESVNHPNVGSTCTVEFAFVQRARWVTGCDVVTVSGVNSHVTRPPHQVPWASFRSGNNTPGPALGPG